MLVFALFPVWLLSVACLAQNVTIAVSSVGNSQNYGYLTDFHETSTEDYFFITDFDQASVYDYNSTSQYLSIQVQGIVYNIFMGSKNDSTVLSIGLTTKPEKLQFDSFGRLQNYNYWACLDINDPQGRSRIQAMILINKRGNNTAPYNTCTKVSLTMVYQQSEGASTNGLANSTTPNSQSTFPATSRTSLNLALAVYYASGNSLFTIGLAAILALLL